MTCIEAEHRIVRALPDDFLKDDGNRVALGMLDDAFNALERLPELEEKAWMYDECNK